MAPTNAKRGRSQANTQGDEFDDARQNRSAQVKKERFDRSVKAERLSKGDLGRGEAGGSRRSASQPEEVDLAEEEYDDYGVNDQDAATLTQQYQSQLDSYNTQTVMQKLSAAEKDKLVAEVMRLMLFSQYRDGAPVQRAKISQLLSQLCPQLKRINLASYVIAEAQVKFALVFGYEMKELERMQQKKTGSRVLNQSEPVKEYVLKSMLPAKSRRRWIDQPADLAWRAFIMTVCSLVRISGGQIEEGTLWKHLAALGVRQDDNAHPKFGNTKAALDRLIKQRYLIREKLSVANSADGDSYGLALAERALDEFGQEGVDAFVQKVMQGEGTDDPAENGDAAAGASGGSARN